MLIKEENHWKKVVSYYIKQNGTWVMQEMEYLSGILTTNICNYGGESEIGPYTLSIMGPSIMRGETCSYFLAKNGITIPQSNVSWSIVSGETYATINGNGELTILSGADNSNIILRAEYREDVKDKPVKVTYMSNVSATTTVETETYESSAGTVEVTTTITEIVDESGNTTTASTTVEIITNESGETTYTETNEVVNDDGSSTSNTSTTNYDENGNVTETQTSEVVENPDGSSSSNTVTVNYDESGNTTGSQTNQTIGNSDGSYGSNTTNYDSEGNPTDTTNESGDTAGNIDTQQVEYDESGTPVVTEYNIDTSGSDGNGKEIEGNGVNTEFVPFKFSSEGFVINFDFASTAAEQPRPPITEDTEDSGSNYLYTVLGAKTTAKVGNIWPGFEIRWVTPKSNNPNFNDDTKCFVQFCRTLCGETSTTRTNFTSGHCANGVYHMTIIYNPAESNPFNVRSNVANANIQSSNKKLQDDVELDLTIGYSTDHNGNQIRHSNLTVHDFNVVKLNSGATITKPGIYCNNNLVSMSCSTTNAKIYYKTSADTKYDLYKSPIEISADTTFNAYAIFQHKVSSVQTNTFTYVSLMPNVPVIYCDGDYVTITCSTAGSSIYYKLGDNGIFELYTSPIEINENVTVYAYSQANGYSSSTVSENCVAAVIAEPVISCNGRYVTITCETENTTIHYKLGENGEYTTYNDPIAISTDTDVYAYATRGSKSSTTAFETCIFNDEITAPIITCDGEHVTLTCETPSVDIYYKLNDDVSYSYYFSQIEISADTTVYAYAMLDSQSSTTVSALCEFVMTVQPPVITCENNEVSMTCPTDGANIYHRFSVSDSFDLYTTPFEISALTFVQAFAELSGFSSTTVEDICIYEDENHDYSQDYLTFKVISGGTIAWKSLGSGYDRTIEYKKNNGTWTQITSTSAGATIQVNSGDVVQFRGSNTKYAGSKSNYSGFEGGTAYFDISGNINSLLYGDNFTNNSALTNATYQFCSIFKKSHVVSAENLILPATVLKNYCYRAMFSYCEDLVKAPQLPATTLAQGCYWYMFEKCAITEAPELLATTLVQECYGYMFTGCANLNYIKCLATGGFSSASALTGWVTSVAATGTFVKDANTTWSRGINGIPNGWIIDDYYEFTIDEPEILCDGEYITISCVTSGASIYYRLNQSGDYGLYESPITISADTITQSFATASGVSSVTVTQNCAYLSSIPLEYSNRSLQKFMYDNNEIETPYSINAIDGHSSSYATGNSFNFETDVVLREQQPTYLWFQHADQSADIYVDNVLVETHWGGYNAFFSDISNYVHSGTNHIKIGLCNKTRNTLAPCKGDFNYNATLGKVKLFTSPVLPDMTYGYDGFHVTSNYDTSNSSATVNVKTNVPAGAVVWCFISGVSCDFSESGNSTGNEMVFTTTISNPRLWNGKIDPYLYDIKLEIYHNDEIYHRYQRGYGIRFFDYAISGTTMSGETGYTYNGQPYTGFLLNGQPYFLRGVCMHDDLAGKANALNDNDYTQEFSIIQELGCNFIRLAHYPHPKEVYDWCDKLGIIVQTEVPWVGAASSGAPTDYYTHLEGQYRDMVNQHYNHPSIVFWGLSNETTTENTTDAKNFIKDKIEGYTAVIKSLDQSRWVGYVMSHSYNNPSSYYNNPNVDWFGGNIYTGWYVDKTTNDPSSQLDTRINNIIKGKHKPLAFSEYGCGGTQRCHSESAETTTTKGTNQPRHDIEYMMWLHEGHVAALRNYPQLLFTGEWQLFDIAVYNRQEGYTICLDGETTSTDNNLKFLNNKGLVERDHITKKDPFYLYKAWWNPTPFVHICGKDYTKIVDRQIKCYTNDATELTMYIGDSQTPYMTALVNDNIAVFSAATFTTGTTIRVESDNASDTLTF